MARALDAMATENEVVQGLLGVGAEAEARRALDGLSGEIHASLQGVLMDDNRRISNAVNRRLAASFPGPDATFAFGHGQPASSSDSAAWLSAYGGWSDADATANTAALDNDLGGIVAGLDREIGKSWRFGVLGSYGHARINQTAPQRPQTAIRLAFMAPLVPAPGTSISAGSIPGTKSTAAAPLVPVVCPKS